MPRDGTPSVESQEGTVAKVFDESAVKRYQYSGPFDEPFDESRRSEGAIGKGRGYIAPRDYDELRDLLAPDYEPYVYFSDEERAANINTVAWIRNLFGLSPVLSVRQADNRTPDCAIPLLQQSFEIKHPTSYRAFLERGRYARTQSRVIVMDVRARSITASEVDDGMRYLIRRYGSAHVDQLLVIADHGSLLWTHG